MIQRLACVTVFLAAGMAACPVSGEMQSVSDPNVPQTLPEYLKYAALHNAGLKAAFEEWKAALEEIPQAGALPDPRFTYGYFLEEIETRVGPQRQRVSLTQAFPWFGTIEAREDAAAAGAKAAKQRFEAAKLQLFYQVKDAFHEYLYLRRAIEIARENLELVRHFEEVARAKYIAATAQHPDIIRAQMQLAVLEDKVKELEELQAPIVARLNAVLNPVRPIELPWPVGRQMDTPDIDREELLAILVRENPRLQAKDFELLDAQSRIELAKKKFYPDLGVGVDWIDTDDAMTSGVPDSGKDPVILMFTMNLPVWRKSYQGAQQQARARARRTQFERKDLENNLLAQAAGVLYAFEDSGRKIALYEDRLVPQAEELVGASETAYTAGTVDFLSLIDAQQTLLRHQLLLERARATRQQRLAELEMLAGIDLGWVESPRQ